MVVRSSTLTYQTALTLKKEKERKKKSRSLRSPGLGKWRRQQNSLMFLAAEISQARHSSKCYRPLERVVWSAVCRQRQRNQLQVLVKSNRQGWRQLVQRINRLLGWFLSFFFFKRPRGERRAQAVTNAVVSVQTSFFFHLCILPTRFLFAKRA